MGGGCCGGGAVCTCPVRRPEASGFRRGPVLAFFPRHTSLIANAAGVVYRSDPFEVTDYRKIAVEIAWQESNVSGDGTLTLQAETSDDLVTWRDLGGVMIPTLDGVFVGTLSDPARYARMAATATADVGQSGLMTMWALAVARRK